jgi:hypothetical protein
MKLKRHLAGCLVAAWLGIGSVSLQAADGTWIRPGGIPLTWLWLVNTNWSGGAFPGETNNAASLNTDVATITNVTPSPVIQIDFSASGANGQFGLGAILVDRTSPSIPSATVRPVVSGGTLTLNGAVVGGVPSTILASRGTGIGDDFFIGDLSVPFGTLHLGRLTNVIQMGENKRITVRNVISERNLGSGITLTSDAGELLVTNSGAFSSWLSNTFTGPVRNENGARWDLGGAGNSVPGNPQALGLSPPDAANLVLDNGVLRGRTIQIGRLFTLGPGGGQLEAAPGVTFGAPSLAFTNTGAIGFEGVGPRTLTLANDAPSALVSRSGLFAPAIGDAPGGGKTSLVRTNTCIWTLTGANTYSGPTTSAAYGAIILEGSGSFANSPTIILAGGGLTVAGVTGGANHDGARFALASGQMLTGNGSVSGAMSVRSGATVAPGMGVGNMGTSHLIFTAPNAVLAEEVDLGVASSADLLQVINGGLDLGGATLNVTLLNAPAVPTSAQTFLLIQNDGSDPITNQFGHVNLSGANASGYQATVDYAFVGTDSLGRVGDGNDLAITLTPATAPTSFSLSLSVTNGIATLTWPSVSDQTYWVQYKSALTNANWDDLSGEVIGTGDAASKTDPVGLETRFYRVRTQ